MENPDKRQAVYARKNLQLPRPDRSCPIAAPHGEISAIRENPLRAEISLSSVSLRFFAKGVCAGVKFWCNGILTYFTDCTDWEKPQVSMSDELMTREPSALGRVLRAARRAGRVQLDRGRALLLRWQ